MTTAGKTSPSAVMGCAPSGISAIRSRAGLRLPPRKPSSAATMTGSRTTGTPKARATPSIVTSSWVGPTPPDVKTTSKPRLNSPTSAAIRSISSGMTTMRLTSTPSARSSRQRYTALASATLPERSSLPMRMMPAVRPMSGLMVARSHHRLEPANVLARNDRMLAQFTAQGDRHDDEGRGTDQALRLGARAGRVVGVRRGNEPGVGESRPQHLRRPPRPQVHPAQRRAPGAGNTGPRARGALLQHQRGRGEARRGRRGDGAYPEGARRGGTGPRHAALAGVRHAQAVHRRSHEGSRHEVTDGHDTRRHGPQPRLLGPGAGRPRPHGPG